jgi:Cu-processing system permease protein
MTAAVAPQPAPAPSRAPAARLSTLALARTIAEHQWRDVLRSRWVVAYALVLAAAAELLLRLGGSGPSALVSLLNVVLLLVPLVALVLGTASLHGAREFTELLLTQPIPRRALFVGLYLGLAIPLAGATIAAIVLPFAIERAIDASTAPALALFVIVAALLVLAFVALAFLVATAIVDRAKGLGAAILLWLALGLVYDGVVLAVTTAFRDWPMEKPMLAMMVLNPIDLARTLLLLRLDVAALMGYTGAVFRMAFGTGAGMALAIAALVAWVAVPWWLAARAFDRRDF